MQRFRIKRRFDIANYIPAIIAVVLIGVIIAVIAFATTKREGKVKISEFTRLDVNIERFVPFLSGVATIEGENIYYVDDRNEKMWGFSGATEDMILYAGSERLGVSAGRKLQVLSADGKLAFSKEFEKNISSVVIGKKLIAVNLSGSDDMIIVNSTGEEVDRIASEVNGTNIRCGVFDDGGIWVITIENSGYTPKYHLSTYRYDTEKKQTITFEVDDQMMYNAVFDGNLCYIFGSEDIMVRDCNYTDSVKFDYSVNGFDVVDYKKIGKNINMLLLNNGNLKAINASGLKDYYIEEKISWAHISSKNYYGFNKYFMYKIKPSTTKYSVYKLPLAIDEMINAGEYVLIMSGGQLYHYAVPK